jgi:galactokinase
MLPVDQLAPLLATHAAPTDGYPVRGVVLFGLAECERSRLGADLLTRGQVLEFGRLMSASHDGDRVVCHDAAGTAMPYAYRVTNGYLLNLMAALESGDAERVIPAQLQWQPGAYRCSTPEIDLMVDTAMQVPGVVGAQLAGAGLGGCMMVLVRREQAGALVARMDEAYYGPRNIKPDMAACKPIAGSGVLLNPRHVRRGN